MAKSLYLLWEEKSLECFENNLKIILVCVLITDCYELRAEEEKQEKRLVIFSYLVQNGDLNQCVRWEVVKFRSLWKVKSTVYEIKRGGKVWLEKMEESELPIFDRR